MPIITDDVLKSLLAEGSITAITLDTNVIDSHNLNLKSAVLRAVVSLKDRPFSFLLSDTIVREIRNHLEKEMEDKLRSVKSAMGDALFAFDTTEPTRDTLLSKITVGHTPAAAAAARVSKFLNKSACEVLDDSSLVDVKTIYNAYFNRNPPFSQGKKTEFPDALALYALERVSNTRDTGFLVVSADVDWRKFCELSTTLYLVPKIEQALSLIAATPIGLRKAVLSWITADSAGKAQINAAVSSQIETIDVDALAYSNSGDVETDAWAAEVTSIDWPLEDDIHLIAIDDAVGIKIRVVVNLPVYLELRFSVELSFSVWDSVDKEAVGMGGRTVMADRQQHTPLTVTLDVNALGTPDEEVQVVDFEMGIRSLEVDLGNVDIFEPEQYDDWQT